MDRAEVKEGVSSCAKEGGADARQPTAPATPALRIKLNVQETSLADQPDMPDYEAVRLLLWDQEGATLGHGTRR